MIPNLIDQSFNVLRRAHRTLVVVDVVESVRLIAHDELGTIDRWRRFVNEVRSQVLPAFGGRLVKHLGDGMLLEFESVSPAVAAALDMQRRICTHNDGLDSASQIQLRAGAHVADIVVDELDVYGTGVNLAARMAALARPGELVASAEVCDGLVNGLDADVEDLGECYLKHFQEPVRAYRLGPAGASPERSRVPVDPRSLSCVVAVLPFEQNGGDAATRPLGDVLADELITGLSRAIDLNIISRLSTLALRGRSSSALQDAQTHLGATFVVAGRYTLIGAKVRVHVELADCSSGGVVWSDGFTGEIAELFQDQSELVSRVVAGVVSALRANEIRRAMNSPMPNLDGYALLMGSIAAMHRATRGEFDRARQMLEHLHERHPRLSLPLAWLAKWHVLCVVQGWTQDAATQTAMALDSVHRSLDANPEDALALTIGGLVHGYLRKDLDAAGMHYERALLANPNEPLAWLFSGTLHSYRGNGPEAERATDHAQRLSPLDPLRYFFDSLSATAVLSNGNHERAIELASRSLRANRTHTSTYRTLAIAQMLAGHVDAAAQTVSQLRLLEPQLTAQMFLDRYPGRAAPQAAVYAQALRAAGLPA